MQNEKQAQPDITPDVQQLIGSQVMQIVTLNKRIQELETMLKAFEKENKNLKKV